MIVYPRLEKKLNEVCGSNDPTMASVAWKMAGVIVDRVKWGLWRHEEALYIHYRGSTAAKAEPESDVNYHHLVSFAPSPPH